MSIEIKSSAATKVGFASHQNSVPVLRELELENSGEETFDHLVLVLSADPPFIETKSWRIESLRAGSTLHITDRDVKLHGGFLAGLTETVIGEVTLRVMRGDEELAATAFPVEILAKNQWGGCGSMPELLPAFCMPNDPAVDRILKGASDILRRAGKSANIDGYESKSRTRTWELASAVWSSVAGLGISYALPPACFEECGQRVRTPGAILEGKVATCLDTALLFASALEQARLYPLLVITKGHAFVGVWLQPQEFSQLMTDEAAAVRKRVELHELLVFETTMVTHSPVPGFSAAVEQGKRQLTDEEFVMVVDIQRARMQRIRPLAISTDIRSDAAPVPVAAPVSESLEEAPILPSFDVEVEPASVSAADKVALWQRKLLDLTTRNRLLHVPDKSKCVPLLCPEPALLEDRLAEGKKIRILPVPELDAGGRDAALYAQQNREDLYEQVARQALTKGEVLSPLTKVKLEAELIDLYRKARSDLDEGGANTLFLALGFLKWKKAADDPKTYRAPLILLPVKLERKSALSGVTMIAHEDEPRFNLTLLELLRQDFELTISGLDGGLPMDESGVNVSLVLNAVRHAVRDIAGFEVTPEIVLGTFSFAKYLMWKDLADRKDQLMQSPVVRHLIERDGESFASGRDFPRPEDLDQKIDPSRLFTPLPADSSQLAAVVASANGCDFVLDGPPGTGKSQTIANMIAHNLALGRRVLFVAEKMAALDVVYRRLQEKGLGEFCLEIHSNKTSKVEVLKQLERAWDTRDALSPEEWAREAAEVHRLRDRLNEVVALLHKRQPNGLTLHQAIGRVVRDASEATASLSWPEGTVHDEPTYAHLRDVARRLDLNLQAVSEVPHAFGVIARGDWSNGWQEAVVAAAADIPAKINGLRAAREVLLEKIHLPFPGEREDEIETLAQLGRTLLGTHGTDLNFAFVPDVNDKVASARLFIERLTEYREIEKGLSVPYAAESCRKIDLTQFDLNWAEAKEKFWFLSTLAKKKVARTLSEQGSTTGVADPEQDLPKLRRMRTLLEEMDAMVPLLSGIPGFAKQDSNTAKMAAALGLCESVRSAIPTLAASPDHLAEVRSAVRTMVVDANELLGPDGKIAMAVSRLEAARNAFSEISKRFRELCGIAVDAEPDFSVLRETAVAIQAKRVQLKAWCDWYRVRDEAIQLGLGSMIQAIESSALQQGQIAPAFETAYARWFAAGVIDAEPKLTHFVSAEHLSDIEAYRKMDDRLSKLSVRYIRAKLCGLIPSKNDVSKRDGFGVLKHELQKQRRHKPLRQLATEMGDAMTRLAPCMLMSPLSIAQYLPADLQLFDLVIFDEASQIAPWDAIGSIARGKQVVIAGDPRQMPPTSFFNRAAAVTDDDVEEDMESILDECLGAGVPKHSLDWHYRSRHESLIAFSNHRYYDSKLITFPAAVTRASAVSWRRVEGIYTKGKGRTNQAEAEAMVAETVKRLKDTEFVGAGKTLGIVTLNSEQQKLVEDLLDKARQSHPEIEPFFSEDLSEPVVVKNLETVQGDERDLIMLGIGYGPTELGANSMSMSFGPLNRDGGWRRLNVAVTRSRQEMMVFTSFDPSMVDLNRTSARAVMDLKHFLEFAHRGPQALAEAVNGSLGDYESPFEEAVANGLKQLGWNVVPQIGVSRFRIDLGIVHPDRTGDYLVGVECDGAAYHSAATARDRDKVRAAVLEGLGWTLCRVWSTDWWVDKQGALQRLHAQINALLEASRARNEEMKEAAKLTAANSALPIIPSSGGVDCDEVFDRPEPIVSPPGRIAVQPPANTPERVVYQITDFSNFTGVIDPENFYDESYDGTLASLVERVLQTEAPILDTLLVQRIARAHGFQRSGRLISERVLEIVDRNHHVQADPVGGIFIWVDQSGPSQWSQFRVPSSEENARKIEEIAFEEFRAALLTKPVGDVRAEIAKLFGVRRLAGPSKERLEWVIKTFEVT